MATARRTATPTEPDDPEVEPTNEPVGIAVEVDPPAPQPETNGNSPRLFTEEEMERARQQEKDKLYARFEEQQKRADEALAKLTADLEARQAAEAEALRKADEAAEAARREETDAKTLIEEAKARFDAELAQVRAEQQGTLAMWQKEQEFQELNAFRQEKVAAALRENPLAIADEFLDYVGGNTREEIEQSLAMAMQKTASIVAQVRGAQQQTRQQAKGASVTAPPVGPMETDQAFEMMSPQDIQNLSMEDYAKRRPALLRAASRAANPGAR